MLSFFIFLATWSAQSVVKHVLLVVDDLWLQHLFILGARTLTLPALRL